MGLGKIGKLMAQAAPCRHCGGGVYIRSVAAKYFPGGVGYYLRCKDSGCPGRYLNFMAGTKRGAIATWNEMNFVPGGKG